MNTTEILSAFNFRHACKEFNPEQKITDNDFTTILEAARLSPSSIGLEPWKLLVIQDTKIQQIFHDNIGGSRTDKGQIPSCSHFIIVLARKNIRYDSDYVKNMLLNVHKLPPDIIEFRTRMTEQHQKVNFDLLANERALLDWATQQTYIALGSMLATAALLGIDSCPLEGFNKAELNSLLNKTLQINLDEFSMAYGLTFGFRVNEPRPKTRNQMQDIVEWF